MKLFDIVLWFVGFVVSIASLIVGLAMDFKERETEPRNEVARRLWRAIHSRQQTPSRGNSR